MPKNLKLLFENTFTVCKAIYNCHSWQSWSGMSKGNAVPLDWRMSHFWVSKDHAICLSCLSVSTVVNSQVCVMLA